jgi:hypothetical protein
MFFEFFTLGANTEKDIIKAGFSVKSYEEVNVYNGNKIEFTTRTPKECLFKGDIWERVNSSEIYERSCLLAKTPYLSFDELWNLLLKSDQDDDCTGALVLMHKQHYLQLRHKYKSLVELKDNISKAEKRALKMLSNIM